jgi:hypothetical protein
MALRFNGWTKLAGKRREAELAASRQIESAPRKTTASVPTTSDPSLGIHKLMSTPHRSCSRTRKEAKKIGGHLKASQKQQTLLDDAESMCR